ncbi:MAG: HDIG domain-containing protein, partial [Candidatus Coatesbacteria bacterium]|nr:HDIG domain-containing protein [Candidatus Coatesbacteria bacterium]
MDRDEAYKLVKKSVKNKNLVKHMLATEIVMEALAERFGEDKAAWGLAGLLHDVDYDQTAEDFPKHGFTSAEILEDHGVDDAILHAIKAHPGHIEAETKMAKALYAVDPLTGLIVASALIHPDKKLSSIDAQFVLNRFKEKLFAKGANREQIMTCDRFGMTLDDFVDT